MRSSARREVRDGSELPRERHRRSTSSTGRSAARSSGVSHEVPLADGGKDGYPNTNRGVRRSIIGCASIVETSNDGARARSHELWKRPLCCVLHRSNHLQTGQCRSYSNSGLVCEGIVGRLRSERSEPSIGFEPACGIVRLDLPAVQVKATTGLQRRSRRGPRAPRHWRQDLRM